MCSSDLFFASDPNLGRILAAVGYAGIADLDQTRIALYLDDVQVVTGGGRNPLYRGLDKLLEQSGRRIIPVLAKAGVPQHPGAARAYRDAGYLA